LRIWSLHFYEWFINGIAAICMVLQLSALNCMGKHKGTIEILGITGKQPAVRAYPTRSVCCY